MSAQPQPAPARLPAIDSRGRLEPIAAAFHKGALARQGLTDLGHEMDRVFQLVTDAQEALRRAGMNTDPIFDTPCLEAGFAAWRHGPDVRLAVTAVGEAPLPKEDE